MLNAKFFMRSAWNKVGMFFCWFFYDSCLFFYMGYLGSKTRSPGQVIQKCFEHTTLSTQKNYYLLVISIFCLDMDHSWSETISSGKSVEKVLNTDNVIFQLKLFENWSCVATQNFIQQAQTPCVPSRGHIPHLFLKIGRNNCHVVSCECNLYLAKFVWLMFVIDTYKVVRWALYGHFGSQIFIHRNFQVNK